MKINVEGIGEVGVVSDKLPSEIPDGAWTQATNCVFRDRIAQSIPGESVIFSPQPTGEPQDMLYYPDPTSGSAYWIYTLFATPDVYIQAWDGSNHILLLDSLGTGLGTPVNIGDGFNFSGYSMGSIAGVPYLNNGAGAPYAWLRLDGVNLDANMQQVTTWPAGLSARMLRGFMNYWILLDITDNTGLRNPSRLMWSEPAQPYQVPTDFLASPTNTAGDVVLGDSSDYLMDALKLRDQMIIYKRNTTWTMRFIGGNSIFSFERLFRDWGLMAPRLMVVVNGTKHFVVTNTQDIMLHDGNAFRSIADEKVKLTIFSEIDGDNLLHAYVAANNEHEEVWFCYPTVGNKYSNRAAIWSWTTGAWSFRDLDSHTSMSYGVAQDSTIDDTYDTGLNVDYDSGPDIPYNSGISKVLLSNNVISTQNGFRLADDGNDFAGTPYTSTFEVTGLDLGDKDAWKYLRGLLPKINGGPINVQVGTASTPDGGYSWSADLPFDTSAGQYRIDTRASGRYFGFRFKSTNKFRIESYNLDIEVLSTR